LNYPVGVEWILDPVHAKPEIHPMIELPEGFRIRPASLDDAPAINALICAYEINMEGEAHHSEIELLQEWQRMGFHLDTDTWVIQAEVDEGETGHPIVGYQEAWHRVEHGILSGDGYVHPDYNMRGIGTAMLRLLEGRAVQLVEQAGPGEALIIRNGVDGLNGAACRLHENEGYQAVRFFWHMEIKLDQAPTPPLMLDGLLIRPFRPGQDERSVYEAMAEAFCDHWGHIASDFDSWQQNTVLTKGFDPNLWLLAIEGEQVVGAALCQGLDNQIGWISQLGVRPAWRRRGLGQALLQAAFNALYQVGNSIIRLSVDAENPNQATHLYEKAGMRPVHQFVVYEKNISFEG
jgi:mycothiol synthase